jgi:hypothetical protein
MKKLTTLAILAATALSAMAQGTMQFQNGATSPLRISTGTGTRTALASDNLVVAMFWGTTASNVVNLGGTAAITTSTQGVFAGSTVFAVAGGTNPGDVLFFQVAAWDGQAYGHDFAGMQACIAAGGLWGSANAVFNPPTVNTGYGVLGPALSFTLGPTAGPGTVMFGSAATTGVFHFFVSGSVPEPSTIALGGLGVASLLLFRRRRK